MSCRGVNVLKFFLNSTFKKLLFSLFFLNVINPCLYLYITFKCIVMSSLLKKGVYISMYSDCLDQNRWYHGKSGYIAIIRLTKVMKNEILMYSCEILTVTNLLLLTGQSQKGPRELHSELH